MREQTRLITLTLTQQDVDDGFSLKETESSVLLLRHGRVIAEFSRPPTEQTEAKESKGGVLLSRRDTEILQYIAGGNETKQIASTLGLKRETVDAHINRMMRKLGARNRSHMVAMALRSGLID